MKLAIKLAFVYFSLERIVYFALSIPASVFPDLSKAQSASGIFTFVATSLPAYRKEFGVFPKGR